MDGVISNFDKAAKKGGWKARKGLEGIFAEERRDAERTTTKPKIKDINEIKSFSS